MTELIIGLMVVLLVIAFIYLGNENYIPYTPDQIGSMSPNPTFYRYFGRQQDRWGYSPKEYFLQNKAFYNEGLLPEMYEEEMFRDNVGMHDERQYYPSSMLAIQSIKTNGRPQHSYYTVGNAPPAVAQRELLANAVADSNDMDSWPFN